MFEHQKVHLLQGNQIRYKKVHPSSDLQLNQCHPRLDQKVVVIFEHQKVHLLQGNQIWYKKVHPSNDLPLNQCHQKHRNLDPKHHKKVHQ